MDIRSPKLWLLATVGCRLCFDGARSEGPKRAGFQPPERWGDSKTFFELCCTLGQRPLLQELEGGRTKKGRGFARLHSRATQVSCRPRTPERIVSHGLASAGGSLRAVRQCNGARGALSHVPPLRSQQIRALSIFLILRAELLQ